MDILLIHTIVKHSKAVKVPNMPPPNLFNISLFISKNKMTENPFFSTKFWQMIGAFGKWSYKDCEADSTGLSGQVHF